MRLVTAGLALALLAAPAAAENLLPQQEGRIPVWGPSKERAAFFAEQQEALEAEYQALQEERAALAAAQALAEAKAEKESALRRYDGTSPRIYRRAPGVICRTPYVRNDPLIPAPAEGTGLRRARPEPERFDTVSRCYDIARHHSRPRYGSDLTITVFPDGVGGRWRYRRPGVRVIIDSN
jgi:hypothetical protein